jgi:hypothetical protein
MATNFPTSVDSLVNPVSNDSLNTPSHSAQHTNANDAIEAIETYLLNGAGKTGLVFLKTVTIGSAVSSVPVTDVFSSTYDNYRVVIAGVDASTAVGNNLRIQFGSTPNEHYCSQYFDGYDAAATGTTRVVNAASILVGGANTSNDSSSSFDVCSPNLATRTTLSGTYNSFYLSGWFGGAVNTTTQYTSFNFIISSGTMTGGTVKVYGYRNS